VVEWRGVSVCKGRGCGGLEAAVSSEGVGESGEIDKRSRHRVAVEAGGSQPR
jgi:hypothetical protein